MPCGERQEYDRERGVGSKPGNLQKRKSVLSYIKYERIDLAIRLFQIVGWNGATE